MNVIITCPRVLLAALVLVACMLTSCTTTGVRLSQEEQSDQTNVELIAQALTRYAKDHEGKTPCRVDQLYPKYIDDKDTFSFHCPGLAIKAGRILLLPQKLFPDPDCRHIYMVGFVTSEYMGLKDCSGHGRFIIDSGFQNSGFRVWWVGEGRFHDWLAGISRQNRTE
jgi:hypothetical protein